MALNFLDDMIKYPINLVWTISESQLITLKNLTENNSLTSDKFTAIHASNVIYFLKIDPNGYSIARQGQTCIFLWLELESEKRVESEFTIFIESAKWRKKCNYVFGGEFEGWGNCFCTTNELFDVRKKFIVNGELVVKVEGKLKIKNLKPEWKFCGIEELWDQNYKDFTIVVKNSKKIKVHKNVLGCRSPVFAAMFNSLMKESIENKVDIPDFSFEIVEKAVKICYHYNLVSKVSFAEGIEIYRFGDKYDIEVIRDFVELYFCNKLTASNFYEIVTFAISVNALKLKKKCTDFLIYCISKQIIVPKIEEVDIDFVTEARNNVLCQFCETS